MWLADTEAARSRFELAYGPGGAWSTLLARRPGFRGTTVLRDAQNPRRYLTIELWETEAQREQALVEHQAEYADLAGVLREGTQSKTEVSIFSVLAEATVRPFGRAGRSKAAPARQSSRRTTR